tara:strand:+ start:2626 stop:3372 length:747 start_codon:yes stop_codon:yes gene_type:complete
MLNNYLCDSEIYHLRKQPFKNYFNYKICSIIFDIKRTKEINNLKLLSINKFNIFSINFNDYGNLKGNLYSFIIRKLKKKYKTNKKYSVHLLTSPKFLGYIFNPISIYFVSYKEKIKYIIYEVRNTHHEKHMYFKKLSLNITKKHSINKKFYVSPFLDMDLKYFFSIILKKRGLKVMINALSKKEKLYTGMNIKFTRLSDKNLFFMAVKRLFYAQKIMILIHFQAIKIFFKRSKFNVKIRKIKNNFSFS